MTDHPIHLAGRYFACHNPEGQWIADQKAADELGEDTPPDKETETSAPCSPSSQS